MGRQAREKRKRLAWRTAHEVFLQSFDRAYDLCAALEPGQTVELSPGEAAALAEVLYGRNRRSLQHGRP